MGQEVPLARAITDLERRLACQDRSALQFLFDEHAAAMVKHLEHSFSDLDHDECLECVHHAFVHSLTGASPYDPTLASAGTYLKRRAEYAAKEYRRERSLLWRALTVDGETPDEVSKSQSPLEECACTEDIQRVRDALRCLPVNHRLALVAWMQWGRNDYRSRVSTFLGVREDVVGQWFCRGSAAMRSILADIYEIDE